METGPLLIEIDSIEKEISNLRKRIAFLSKRHKELTENVIETLKVRENKEYVYNGKLYQLQEKILCNPKSTKKKKEDVIQVLNKNGIRVDRGSELATQIDDALKGKEKTIYSLKK